MLKTLSTEAVLPMILFQRSYNCSSIGPLIFNLTNLSISFVNFIRSSSLLTLVMSKQDLEISFFSNKNFSNSETSCLFPLSVYSFIFFSRCLFRYHYFPQFHPSDTTLSTHQKEILDRNYLLHKLRSLNFLLTIYFLC